MDMDILVVGDFRFPGGTSTSIASEVRALAQAGYRVGLMALATGPLTPRHPIHPEILALHETGLAALVPPGVAVEADLCCLHHPAVFTALPALPPLVTSRQRVIIAHHPAVDAAGVTQYDVQAVSSLVAEVFGPALWAPVGPAVRETLLRQTAPPPMLAEDWHNILDPDAFAAPRLALPRRLPVLGRHSRPGPEKWPDDRETFLAAYPDDPGLTVRLMGYSAAQEQIVGQRPANWEVLPFGALPVPAFLGSLDYFSYFHSENWIEAFGRSVLEAMASGLICLLPPAFRPLFGDGAVYCSPDEVLAHVRRFEADPAERQAQAARAIAMVRDRYGPGRAIARAEALIGPPARAAHSVLPASPRQGGGVLYFTSNGVGMGHLTRCMATARRLSPGTPATIVTMSKAFEVVRDEGIAVEYLPYFRAAGLEYQPWTQKLAAELTEILRYRAPDVFVFDGNVPYDGLIAALEQFPALWKVWQRRPLWRPDVGAGYLDLAGHFDVVLEPGEIAAPVDRGLTVEHQAAAFRVPPVRLLDAEEALPRRAAQEILGLDPARPAVLLQLGSGNNFDLGGPARMVFDMADPARGGRDLQVVMARWRISESTALLPPHVRLLEDFPISRYLAAFDCAVATAGYNTFHENIAAGLPTLFVPNDHPEQDEQWLRADYAALRGLALSARADDPYALRRSLEHLLRPATRAALAAACAAAAPANGAAQAAGFLQGLALTRKRAGLAFRPAGAAR